MEASVACILFSLMMNKKPYSIVFWKKTKFYLNMKFQTLFYAFNP